ncbi:MAG: histidine ammonia-lyase, partial [Anaerolineae bacterium]|jgi:histidine ammonia-lyase
MLEGDRRLGRGTSEAYEQIRSRAPFLEHDAPLAPHIDALTDLVRSGSLVDAVTAVLGSA